MAKLVLFGATGYAGSKILAEALRRGHQLTAVARHTEALPTDDPSVRNVAGSLYDPNLLNNLTAGADVMVIAITSGPSEDGHTLPDALPGMVAAAQRNKVRIGGHPPQR